ncbi:reverse transcriptase domain-containing protein [Tanacetum coccineum]
MTRSTIRRLTKPLDEPKREIHQHRKAARRHQQNESFAIARKNLFENDASSFVNIEPKTAPTPKSLYEHSCSNPSGFQNSVVLPKEQTGTIINSRDIWLIQSVCQFQGVESENPFQHLKLFLSIVDNIQVDGATKDASRLRFFHFTLKGKAKEWLDRLPPGRVTTWEQLVSQFLNKFFPPECTTFIRDKILRFRQENDEPIKDAWRRFQDLLQQAPHHGIKRWLLV